MTEFSGQVAIITGASGLLASGVIPIFLSEVAPGWH